MLVKFFQVFLNGANFQGIICYCGDKESSCFESFKYSVIDIYVVHLVLKEVYVQ